ncbi:2-oxo-3-deoxygalactonate kinase, partial [Methylobacterium radiotolerans]
VAEPATLTALVEACLEPDHDDRYVPQEALLGGARSDVMWGEDVRCLSASDAVAGDEEARLFQPGTRTE